MEPPAGIPERRLQMIRKLFATDDNTATTIPRLVMGVVFFAHGAQKMLGWFGGFGFSGTMGFFTGTMHIPAPLAFLPPLQIGLQRPREMRRNSARLIHLSAEVTHHVGAGKAEHPMAYPQRH